MEQEEGEVGLSQRLEKLEVFVAQWWARWQEAAFLLFTPRRKWSQAARNLCPGDVVMLLSDSKLGPASYRLGLVSQVFPDPKGVVRTAMVRLRNRRRRGAVAGVEEVKMAAQRLSVILPVEEKWVEGLATQEA